MAGEEKCPHCGKNNFTTINTSEGLIKECLNCGYGLDKKFAKLESLIISRNYIDLQKYIDTYSDYLKSQSEKMEEENIEREIRNTYSWSIQYAGVLTGVVVAWIYVLFNWKPDNERLWVSRMDIGIEAGGTILFYYIINFLFQYISFTYAEGYMRFSSKEACAYRKKVSIVTALIIIALYGWKIIGG